MGRPARKPVDTPLPDNWFDVSAFFCARKEPIELRPSSDSKAPKEPFSSLVEADKTSRAYSAHSYPTKVPPEAIEQFIRYYTKPEEVVVDPFCGSGMTGVAARRAGRRAVLSDLSPLAIHLAFNHTTECDPHALTREWERIAATLRDEISRLYGISCDNCHRQALVRYTIWSDVYECPECGQHLNFWHEAVDQDEGTVSSELDCDSCGHSWRRSAESRVDVQPTWVAYNCSCQRGLRRRRLTKEEREAAKAFNPNATGCWFPTCRVERYREMYKRSALHLRGIETVADFYTPRNLSALALLWRAIGDVEDQRVRGALAFAFTNTAWHGTKMRRYNARGGHRPLTGTLYIPQLSSEVNVFDVFGNKISHLARFYSELNSGVTPETEASVRVASATQLEWIADGSVDYVFTDPPFGSNIFYADCNLIAESWLGAWTDLEMEAVINRSRDVSEGGKTLEDYRALLTAAFSELYRILKPGHWATIVFQSSDGEVWSAIQDAASAAGFSFANANGIDKGQKSMKGYKGRSGHENVASFDILLNLRKEEGAPSQGRSALCGEELERFVVDAVQSHLSRVTDESSPHRTLPYLYSSAVRALLNERLSVEGFSMADLRQFLESRFTERSGRWFTRSEKPEAASATA